MSDAQPSAETHTWTPDAQGAIDGPEPLTSNQSALMGWMQTAQEDVRRGRIPPFSVVKQMLDEIEAARDMLMDARIELNLLREALGVDYEPHQTLHDRMLDAANHKRVERTADEPSTLPPKLDATMPTVWHYLLVAAHEVVEAVDFNHENRPEPLKWTVPWAKVTRLRDAVLKAKALNGSPGPSEPPGDGWIAVTERLPVWSDDKTAHVLGYSATHDWLGTKFIVIPQEAFYWQDPDEQGMGTYDAQLVTHWKPLSPPSATVTKEESHGS